MRCVAALGYAAAIDAGETCPFGHRTFHSDRGKAHGMDRNGPDEMGGQD